jgi:hypothetical protein
MGDEHWIFREGPSSLTFPLILLFLCFFFIFVPPPPPLPPEVFGDLTKLKLGGSTMLKVLFSTCLISLSSSTILLIGDVGGEMVHFVLRRADPVHRA